MANKETVNKVKSLLEGHCYGPLRDAAEKWLAAADDKYDIKEKAGQAWEKINEAADKVADASGKFSEKMDAVSDALGDKYEELSVKAGPALEKLGDRLGDLADKYSDVSIKAGEKLAGVSDKLAGVSDKLGDAAEKLAEAELIKQLKNGITSVGELSKTFGAEDAADKFGEDFAEKMKAHAAELKAKGETFCDCEACRKARSILKDFGEEIEIPEAPAEDESAE